MKKLLALVLALVMTLSLCTISNAAYSDAKDVDYKEAVDVMSAVGVFQGADGKFSPKAELTREQAAKLIAYLDLGEKTAEALPAVKVFNDVEANRWSAKYVAYCADAGYLAGVGNGNFDPAGKLTGYAFGKMLLCVLGYDAAIEGFTGANWQIAVAKLMQSNDIAKSVDASSSATLTREAAAQYCLNTLKADMVEYENKGTSVTINGAVIATGASKAEVVTAKNSNKYVAISGEVYAGNTDYTVQLGEKLFDGRLSMDTNGVNGVAGHTWMYKTSANAVAKSVSAFVATENVLGTSADATALIATTGPSLTRKDNTNSKFIATLNTTYTVFVNGTEVPVYADGATPTIATTVTYFNATVGKLMTPFAADKINSIKDADVDVNGNGVLYTLVDTDRNAATAEKVYITTYTVDVVNKAPVVKTGADGKDYIYIDMVTTDLGIAAVTGAGALEAENVTGYEGLVKDDVVTVVNLADGPVQITKAEPVKATMTAKSGTTLTINGTAVEAAEAANASWAATAPAVATNFFCDPYGYGIFSRAVSTATKDYLMAASVGGFDSGVTEAENNKIQAVFADGSVKVISVEKVGSNSWSKGTLITPPVKYAVYSYSVNEDGTYNLTAATTLKQASSNNGEITKGVSAVAQGTAGDGDAIKGNADTKYVVYNANTKTYTVYTGYTNVPSMTGIKYSAVNGTDTFADVVFAYANTPVAATSKDVVYLLSTDYTTVYKDNGDADYWTLPAVVNGEKTDVKLSIEPTNTNLTNDTTGISANANDIEAKQLYAATFTDGKLAAKSLTLVTGGTDYVVPGGKQTVKSAAGGVLTINSVGYNFTDTTKVYVISAGPVFTVTETTVDDIDEASYTVWAVTKYAADTTTGAAGKLTLTAIYLQK